MRVLPGKTFTRPGLGALATLGTGAIRTFYNQFTIYLGVEYSRLLYLEAPNLIKLYYLDGSVGVNPSNQYSLACSGLSIAEAETRLYVGHYTANGSAAGPLRVLNQLVSGTPDIGFPDPPASVVITVHQGGSASGSVAAGTHKFCVRIISRTGFPGKPSVATSFVVGAGGRSLTVDVTTTAMTDSQTLQLCMTTADNTEEFFDIPGATAGWPPGQTNIVGIPVDISDDELVALPDTASITPNFDYLSGAGAPQPSVVVAFGNRNVYVAGNKIYISDPYDLQVLVEDQNAIQVEGQRFAITVCPLGASLVIFGPNWTFSIGGDNNRKPREWAPPVRVSDKIGTQCVKGAAMASGHSFIWVVSDVGLYIYNGAYGEIPVSIMFDADWKRINWVAARAFLQMEDNAVERCLYINVPLDASTECNYRMVIDYSRARVDGGVNPYLVDYTLDDYNGASPTPSIGPVRNETTKEMEICVGLSDGTLKRHDPALRTDNVSHSIHSVYETGLNLAASETKVLLNRFGGMHAQLKGSGDMTTTPYGLGRQVTSDDPVDILPLNEIPDGEEEARWHMVSENQSIRMETGGSDDKAGAWFELSRLKAYYKRAGTTKAA